MASRGRPRDRMLDKEIRDAAWRLISELGCSGLTYEAIAQTVGCSRSTLYRRFSNKADLISHLLDETAKSFAPKLNEQASPRDKLIAHAATCAKMYAGDKGAALLHIAAEARRDVDIAKAFDAHQNLVAPHYESPLRELAPDAKPQRIQFALHTLMGTVVHHVATRRHKLRVGEIEQLVDASIRLCSTAD